MALTDADTARVEAILGQLEALVAAPGRTFPNFPQAAAADALEFYAYNASAATEIDRNQRLSPANLRTIIGPSGLSLSQLSSTSVTFSDATWKGSGSVAVPADAALILVDVSGPAEVVSSSVVGAAAWRLLASAGVGGSAADAGLPLIDAVYQGHPLRLRLGRRANNRPLLAWDRGRSGLSAATVTIRTA